MLLAARGAVEEVSVMVAAAANASGKLKVLGVKRRH